MSRWHRYIKNDPRYVAARVECFERDDYTCLDCDADTDLQADHVIPLAVLFAGGVTDEAIEAACDVDNLATRCGPCNRAKSDRETPSPGQQRPTWVNPKWSADLVL